MTRKLYEQEVRHHLLALREHLVRHDENLKAHTLMSECVPYFLRGDPDVVRAADDQQRMVAHVLPGHEIDYADYYATNVHERPFEEQYGIPVDGAGRIPRVRWLADGLSSYRLPDMTPSRLLDLGCNDGWMLVYLLDHNYITSGFGIDLNPDCIKRAQHRSFNKKLGFMVAPVESAYYATKSQRRQGNFDAVSCFEVLEHVYDPIAVLSAAARCVVPGGPIYFSTPHGAVEQGEIPNWDHVEPKGHVRAVHPEDIAAWIVQVEDLDETSLQMGSDGQGLILCKVNRKVA